MRLRSDDRAEGGGVIGEIAMVVLVVAASGAILFAYMSHSAPPPPAAVGLNEAAATGGTKPFTVSTTAAHITWGDVTPLLNGAPLSYDSTLASDGTYCIAASGPTCGALDPALAIGAGQEIMIHHSALAGKTFALRQNEVNAILYSKLMGSG